jgi:hypothetical protein
MVLLIEIQKKHGTAIKSSKYIFCVPCSVLPQSANTEHWPYFLPFVRILAKFLNFGQKFVILDIFHRFCVKFLYCSQISSLLLRNMFHYVSNLIENFMKYEINIADKKFRDWLVCNNNRYSICITYKILRNAK